MTDTTETKAGPMQAGLILPGSGPDGEGLGCVDFDTAFMRTVKPEPGDIDQMGHVNNVVYLRWVQDIATTHWFSMAPDSMAHVCLFVVLKHTIEYRSPIEPGQSVEVRTWLGNAQGPRFGRHVDIRTPGAKRYSARAETSWCFIDAETRRPKRVSQDVLDVFGVPG